MNPIESAKHANPSFQIGCHSFTPNPRGPLQPKEVAAAAIRSGLLIPPEPPKFSVDQLMNRKSEANRTRPERKRTGDKVSRRAQAVAMFAANWPLERIAKNLAVTVRCVQNYLRD